MPDGRNLFVRISILHTNQVMIKTVKKLYMYTMPFIACFITKVC